MISINEDGLQRLIDELNKEIEEIKEIQDNIDKKMKLIDGTTDIWKGRTQDTLYNEYYKDIKNAFPNRIQKIQDFKEFLTKTLENYINEDKSLNKDIENSDENLKIND